MNLKSSRVFDALWKFRLIPQIFQNKSKISGDWFCHNYFEFPIYSWTLGNQSALFIFDIKRCSYALDLTRVSSRSNSLGRKIIRVSSKFAPPRQKFTRARLKFDFANTLTYENKHAYASEQHDYGNSAWKPTRYCNSKNWFIILVVRWWNYARNILFCYPLTEMKKKIVKRKRASWQ